MLRTAAVHSINSAELRRNRGLPSMNIQVATNCSISQDENGIATLNLPWLCRWFRVEQTRFEGRRKKSKISNAYFRAKFSTFCFTIVYYQEDKIEMPKASNKWFVRLLLCWPWRGEGASCLSFGKEKTKWEDPYFCCLLWCCTLKKMADGQHAACEWERAGPLQRGKLSSFADENSLLFFFLQLLCYFKT